MSRFLILCAVVLASVVCCRGVAVAAADRDGVRSSAPREDPVEQEFQRLMEDDDAAQDEVDRWIRDNDAFAQAGAGARPAALRVRIQDRFDRVRKTYEDFLRLHPDHARAHLAFGSFLNDINDEAAAEKHWDRALELDPKNPAAWNNLANLYGHSGPVTKAFDYYEKAISLKSNEPVYYQNLATTVYLFRKDAMEHFKCDEAGVFDKALGFYRQAIQFAPQDFPLATDYAQTFYGIKPMRTNDALVAWTNALAIAHDDIEREGVQVHFARIKLNAGQFAEARQHLNSITNAMYDVIKARLQKNLAEKETGGGSPTNSPSATPAKD